MLLVPDDLEVTARSRERLLKTSEERLEEAVGAAIRRFLARAKAEIGGALTAAGPPLPASWVNLLEVGTLQGWWAEELDQGTTDAVRQTWQAGRASTTDLKNSVRSLDSAGEYLALVRDRLSRTATPTIPEQAFNIVRGALADELALGSSTSTTARRIAAELNWQGQDVGFWSGRLEELNSTIDRELDGLGPQFVPDPNNPRRRIENPVRREARLADPRIASLQAARREAVARLDRDRSTWQTRATRIARTETTGAFNAGAQTALLEERAGAKMWLASGDEYTRDSHLQASNQCVGTNEPFRVGGSLMMFPGDSRGPADETVNCRCTMIGGRDCADLGGIGRRTRQRVDAQRTQRGLPPSPDDGPTTLTTPRAAPREFDAAGRPVLTKAELDEVQKISTMDLYDPTDPANAAALDDLLGRLPDGAQFELARVKTHGPVLTDLLCRVSGRRLYGVEKSVSKRVIDPEKLLDDGIREVEAAIPVGAQAPVQSVFWSPAPFQNVRGLASHRMITMHGTAGDIDYLTTLRPGTIRHEVGHSIARAASLRAQELALEVDEAVAAVRARADAAMPQWLADHIEGSPLFGEGVRNGTLKGPDILAAWKGPREGPEWEEAQTAVRRYVRARNAANKEITEAFDGLAEASPYWGDQLKRLAETIRAGTATPGSRKATFNAPRNFQRAAEADAARLLRDREVNAARYRGAKFDDTANWKVSLEGRHDWQPGVPRPGVTEYASSQPQGVEDWAESWRLFVLDRQTGRIGRTAQGAEIRFADLFPNRARAIEEWAETMGYDLTSLGRFVP